MKLVKKKKVATHKKIYSINAENVTLMSIFPIDSNLRKKVMFKYRGNPQALEIGINCDSDKYGR